MTICFITGREQVLSLLVLLSMESEEVMGLVLPSASGSLPPSGLIAGDRSHHCFISECIHPSSFLFAGVKWCLKWAKCCGNLSGSLAEAAISARKAVLLQIMLLRDTSSEPPSVRIWCYLLLQSAAQSPARARVSLGYKGADTMANII